MDTAFYRCPACGDEVTSDTVVDPTFATRMDEHIAACDPAKKIRGLQTLLEITRRNLDDEYRKRKQAEETNDDLYKQIGDYRHAIKAFIKEVGA